MWFRSKDGGADWPGGESEGTGRGGGGQDPRRTAPNSQALNSLQLLGDGNTKKAS